MTQNALTEMMMTHGKENGITNGNLNRNQDTADLSETTAVMHVVVLLSPSPSIHLFVLAERSCPSERDSKSGVPLLDW